MIAVPPAGLDRIGGAVPEEIRKGPEYRALLSIRIVIINQVWDRKGWDQSVYTDDPRCAEHWEGLFAPGGIARGGEGARHFPRKRS